MSFLEMQGHPRLLGAKIPAAKKLFFAACFLTPVCHFLRHAGGYFLPSAFHPDSFSGTDVGRMYIVFRRELPAFKLRRQNVYFVMKGEFLLRGHMEVAQRSGRIHPTKGSSCPPD